MSTVKDRGRARLRALLTRAVVIPVAFAGALLALTAGLGMKTPPTAAASTTKTVTVAEAQRSINAQVHDLATGLDCYSDPTGHHPSTAIIKADGGFTAHTVTATTARRAAQAGTHWVLAWCDAKDTP